MNPTSGTILGTSVTPADIPINLEFLTSQPRMVAHLKHMQMVLSQFLTKEQFRDCAEHIPRFFALAYLYHCPRFSTGIERLGVLFALETCLIKHSCVPTVNCNFSGHELVLKIIRPVTVTSVLDLSISRILLAKHRARRREELRSAYFIECDCDMCADRVPEVLTVSDDVLLKRACVMHEVLLKHQGKAREFLATARQLLEPLDAVPVTDAAKFQLLLVAADAATILGDVDAQFCYNVEMLPAQEAVYTPYYWAHAAQVLYCATLASQRIILKTQRHSMGELGQMIGVMKRAQKALKLSYGEDHEEVKKAQSLYNAMVSHLTPTQRRNIRKYLPRMA